MSSTVGMLNFQKTDEHVDVVQRALAILPWVLADNVSTVGGMALLATLLRYWVLLPLGLVVAAWAIWYVYCWHHPKYRAMLDDETRGAVSIGRYEVNKLAIVTVMFMKIMRLILSPPVLTGLTITANINPSFMLPGLAWEVILYIFPQS